MGREPAPRGDSIKKLDWDKHSYTNNCLGCKYMLKSGGISAPHTEACRAGMDKCPAVTDPGKVRTDARQGKDG